MQVPIQIITELIASENLFKNIDDIHIQINKKVVIIWYMERAQITRD